MKLLNVIRGLYNYYSSGPTSQIPYFSTIGALVLLVVIHIIQLTIILKKFLNINIDFFPLPDSHRGLRYLLMAIYLLPIYLLLTKIFPQKKLADHDLTEKQMILNKYIFFGYVSLNVLVIIGLVADRINFHK